MAYPVIMKNDDAMGETTTQYNLIDRLPDRLPSRGEQRRQALDVLALAGQLLELDPGRLEQLPLPEVLHAHILQGQRITSHIARKRQRAFIAKQMRREEDAVLAAIRDALDVKGEAARQDNARLHRIESWRTRLLNEGDAALGDLLRLAPEIDRQHLRQLLRQAHHERQSNKSPRAFRALFRYLNETMQDTPPPPQTVLEGDGQGG